MSDDPVERPPLDALPPATDDKAVEATDPDRRPVPSSDRGGRLPFWDLNKASFAVQVFGVVVAVVGVLIALVVGLHALRSGSSTGSQIGGDSKATSPPTSHKPSEVQATGPEPPGLSSNASCSDFTNATLHGRGHQVLVDSPGEIDGGSGMRARVLPGGSFLQVIKVVAGDEVEISALLHNGNFSAADGISVSASISPDHGRCWRLDEAVRVQTSPGGEARLGPALILLENGGPATLRYVQGSTKLEDHEGRTLAVGLPDGMTRGWISLPYSVPGGTAYFLSFRVRVQMRRRHLSRSS